MGQGGQVILLNATNNTWTRTNVQATQMAAWSWPQTVAPGQSVSVYVEYDQKLLFLSSKDSGNCDYTSDDGNASSFQMRARSPNSDFQMRVCLNNFTMPPTLTPGVELTLMQYGIPKDFVTKWYWAKFIVSGTPGSYIGTSPPTSWMQKMLPILGQRQLRRICLPGSHDSGMSQINKAILGSSRNTQTQTLDIAGQLAAGVRWFDIRPTVLNGQYSTGHYSNVDIIGVVGALGQTIISTVTQVNTFAAQNGELIILNLSHTYNVNTKYNLGQNSLTAFSAEDWDGLIQLLLTLNNRAPIDSTTGDISTYTPNTFINSGKSSIICVFPRDSNLDLSKYTRQGFIYSSQLPYMDNSQWSNTSNNAALINDQISKLQSNRASPDSPLWLVQWILTLQGADNLLGSIISNSQICNPNAFTSLWNACSTRSYPNAIILDNVNDELTALCIAINNYFGRSP